MTQAATAERTLTLEQALEAARLLGRWSLIAQRHGGGCSCCPGLGDVAMEEVEARLLAALRKQHPFLQGRDSLTEYLRGCVKRSTGDDPQAVEALFRDLGTILTDLENIQRGMW